ncbi:MAG: hypothetical protein M1834_003540 [Cirrosporium novae-zelandiae]|nr:MAG: hypothetical protein M1834_003540 [Cirrosporium novae-zelandiae]
MWILECDGGDILHHKRLWLKPGKRFLIGRTNPAKGNINPKERGVGLDEKTLSRKHITLEIGEVKSGDGAHINSRSQLKVTDENSKVGTWLDGESIKGQSRILTGVEHELQLGRYKHLFRIKWHPVVLSFSFAAKETKHNNDPLIPIRRRLEDLEIKTILPYVHDHTTHVVASKRNTAKGLQALVNGKYIVSDDFIDALQYAATPKILDEVESLSPLEEDFDGSWPDPMQYIPPPGKEPVERPASMFAPDHKRATIFEGYTFVFCDETQFENLQPPISDGGGKALYFELRMGETTVEDIVRYVNGISRGGSGKGRAVLVVLFNGKKQWVDWALGLGGQVAQTLNQRLVQQSEFLDVILCNDAGIFRRQLEEESNDRDTTPSVTAASIKTINPPPSSIPDSSAPTKQHVPSQASSRRRPKTTIAKRFKGFDDGFDVDSFPEPAWKMEEDPSQAEGMSGEGATQHASQGTSIADPLSQMSSTNDIHTRSSRKRSIPPSDDEDDEDVLESLKLPGASAMKKRRLKIEEDRERRGLSAEPSQNPKSKRIAVKDEKAVEPIPEPKKKLKKKLNLLEAARERRKAEEEAQRRDQENINADLEGVDIERLRDLAVIEEMEVPIREARNQREAAQGNSGNRWDERWNGRKNFKKFRQRGEAGIPRRSGHNVIVPLEEVGKKSFLGGDEEAQWLESGSQKRKRTLKERQPMEEVTKESDSDSEPTRFRRKPTRFVSRASSASASATFSGQQMTAGDNDSSVLEAIDVDEPPTRQTRLAEKTAGSQSTINSSSQRATRGKTKTSTIPAKRQRKFALAQDDDSSDSDDGLRFKFKKRR